MSSDSGMVEAFKIMKEHHRQRRKKNLENADPTGWHQYTEYHWWCWLNGAKLQYWPSRNKFMYKGKVMVGDVDGFIRNQEKKHG